MTWSRHCWKKSERVPAFVEIRSSPFVWHPTESTKKFRTSFVQARPSARKACPPFAGHLPVLRSHSPGARHHWQLPDLRVEPAWPAAHSRPRRHAPRSRHIRVPPNTTVSFSLTLVAASRLHYSRFQQTSRGGLGSARSEPAQPAMPPIANSRRNFLRRPVHPDPARQSIRDRAGSGHELPIPVRREIRAGSPPIFRAWECRDRWWARRAGEGRLAAASTERLRRGPVRLQTAARRVG